MHFVGLFAGRAFSHLCLPFCKDALAPGFFHNPSLQNLPGKCWAEIQQPALKESSSSLHSETRNALGASDGVIHSRIS